MIAISVVLNRAHFRTQHSLLLFARRRQGEENKFDSPPTHSQLVKSDANDMHGTERNTAQLFSASWWVGQSLGYMYKLVLLLLATNKQQPTSVLFTFNQDLLTEMEAVSTKISSKLVGTLLNNRLPIFIIYKTVERMASFHVMYPADRSDKLFIPLHFIRHKLWRESE